MALGTDGSFYSDTLCYLILPPVTTGALSRHGDRSSADGCTVLLQMGCRNRWKGLRSVWISAALFGGTIAWETPAGTGSRRRKRAATTSRR